MILSFSFQIKITLLAFGIGFIMGVFYDIIRVFRNIIFHKNILVHIEDIIYWVFMSIVIFLIILYENNGEIRAFFIAFIMIGMYLYFIMISKVFLGISYTILHFIKGFIKFIIECIFMPFKIVFKILHMIFYPVLKLLEKIFKKFQLNIKKVLQNNKKCVKIYNKGIYVKKKIYDVFNKKGDTNEK